MLRCFDSRMLLRCNNSLRIPLKLIKNFFTSANEKIKNNNFNEEKEQVVLVTKRNIPQSPWKMRFLVMLIRDSWVPDAMAQLKFSPKPRCEDVSRIVKRGIAIAKLHYNAIPEELKVKEVLVTKGMSIKKMRIMGRGRTGMGYKRYSHVRIQLEKINFDEIIASQKTYNQKLKWTKRKLLVNKLKSENIELTVEQKV